VSLLYMNVKLVNPMKNRNKTKVFEARKMRNLVVLNEGEVRESKRKLDKRVSLFALGTEYYKTHKIKDNEMGRAGGTDWTDEKVLICKPEGRWHFGRNRSVLKCGRVQWGSLAQEWESDGMLCTR